MNTTISKSSVKNSRTFIVGAIGISGTDFNRLSRIFGVTGFRPRAYKLIIIDPNKKLKNPHIDIHLVDACNPNSIYLWEKYIELKRNNNQNTLQLEKAVRLISTRSVPKADSYNISTPINPIRVLKTLDNYTIRELNYLPEFEIGHDNSLKENTKEGIKLLKSESVPTEKHKNALIVDDSLAVRRQLEIEFDLLGAKSHLTDNGEDAINAANKTRFDIIFLDVVMPGIDGYATCKKIKKSKYNRNTPVVLLTSRSSSFDKFKGTLAGCDTYLTKPINHNTFNTIARQYLAL